MGDFGITRTIDHAVYMLLNSIAIILWRIDAAIIQFSLLSYVTQDWLVGKDDSGVWRVLSKMIGSEGIFGLSTWNAFVALALTLYGFSLLIRPFWRVRPVDLGRMFFFAVLSYSIITEGGALMQSTEAWRSEAGGYMYEIVSGEGGPDLDIPGDTPASADDEPIYNPQDLDGRAPIRGWEAVSTSYFLVRSADELHANVPPEDFRREYCLYDPTEPIEDQAEENDEGCSPAKAWDEWDLVSTGAITQVWGINLPIDITVSVPIFQDYPENRQLAIRQAQAGVARLALGPVVALFPMVEANVGLMLTLSASFIYLSLPLVLLFGLFTYTEPMVNRLVMQLIGIILRTMILHGLMALFMMLLIKVSINGSLSAYLGLIGVGLLGGFFLMKLASGTMRETLSQSMGALGSLWVGTATGAMGEAARAPAMSAMGAAKWAGAGVLMGAAGVTSAWDMWETSRTMLRSGSQDLNQASPEVTSSMRSGAYHMTHRLPEPLARMAQSTLADITAAPPPPVSRAAHDPRVIAPLAGQIEPAPAGGNGYNPYSNGTAPIAMSYPSGQGRPDASYTPSLQNVYGTTSIVNPSTTLPAVGVYAGDMQRSEAWLDQVYAVRERGGRGQRQVLETGREFLGDQLAQQVYQASARHPREETAAVMQATRQAVSEAGSLDYLLNPDGSLSGEGVQAVRQQLDETTRRSFRGGQGEQDLEVLVAAGLQPQKKAEPQAFREVTASAKDWEGENAAGRMVPRKLGLAEVSSGSHFAGLNRFTKLSEQAGLSEEQRQQLLQAVHQETDLPSPLRKEIETSLRLRQEKGLATGLKVDDLVNSARSLPDTLEGPMIVRLAREKEKEQAPRIEKGPGQPEVSSSSVPLPEPGRVQTDLKQEFRAAARQNGRGRNGKGSNAAGTAAKLEKKENGSLPGDSPPANGGGQVRTNTKFLEEEEIKGKAATQKPKQPAQRDPLPTLKGLEDEALPLGKLPAFKKTEPGETHSPAERLDDSTTPEG